MQGLRVNSLVYSLHENGEVMWIRDSDQVVSHWDHSDSDQIILEFQRVSNYRKCRNR